MKKKLLIVTPGYFPAKHYGGPVASVSNLTASLRESVECYIVTSNHDLKDPTPLSGISPGWNEVDGAKVMYLSDEQMKESEFFRICGELAPDCIYLNAIFHRISTPAMLRVAKRQGIRCVLAIRGGLSENALQFGRLKKLLYLTFLRRYLCRQVTFQSTSSEETKAIGRYLPRGNTVCEVPNLPRQMDLSAIPPKAPKEVGSIRLIFVSRIHPIKNLDYILQVLKNVKCQVTFDIYGPQENKEYWSRCEELIGELPCNVTVNYCGFLEHDRLHEVYRKYDLFVLPTQTENFGHAIAEALLEGCNVLISDNTPWTDVNDHGVGRAIPLSCPQAYVDYIEEIAGMDTDQLDAMRAPIKNYLDEHFSFEELRASYMQMFFGK